jgi:hypothetical protein
MDQSIGGKETFFAGTGTIYEGYTHYALGFTLPLTEMSTGNIKNNNVSGE